jgi:hypothetical protein
MNTYLEKIKTISLNTKYTKWYIDIIKKALDRNSNKNRKELKKLYGYIEEHHIFPKSFNIENVNDRENLVFLLPREHFICHLCLSKMFNGELKNKMVYAFFILKSKNKHQENRYFSSRFYSLIKRNHFEKNQYVRLYFKDKVKYINKNSVDEINEFIKNNWSFIMTEEYKEGRVGNMKGRKHNDESKQKISNAHKGILKPWLINKSKEQLKDMVVNMIKTRNENKTIDPNYYRKGIEEGILKRKKLIKDGLLSFKGDKNPRYGVIVDESTKTKIKEKQERHHNNGLTHSELYNSHIKKYIDEGKNYNEISELLTFIKRTPRKIREICNKFKNE